MEEEMDTFPFVLALDLGQSLSAVDAMPYPHYIAWEAYYTWRAAMAELAAKRRG